MSEINKDFWDSFYAANDHIPSTPSSFAEYILPYIDKSGVLVDLGCGNGRDSVYFAQNGVRLVYAVDYSKASIDQLNESTKDVDHLQFIHGDFSKLAPKEELHLGIPEIDTVYSRFTLHAVTREAASKALKWTYDNLSKDGLFCVEARSVLSDKFGVGTPVDGEPDAFILGHYRRFIRMAELLDELKGLGFTIVNTMESAGVAVYKDDDPVVVRVIARK